MEITVQVEHETVAEAYERKLHRLLNQAVELPPEQWRVFLGRAADNAEMAIEVESLLRESMTYGDDFLSSPLATGEITEAMTAQAAFRPHPGVFASPASQISTSLGR